MAANEHRGEVEIDFAGKKMVMRATFDALARIESGTGMGVVALAKRYMSSDFGIRESATIITEGLRAGSEKGGANYAAVGEQIMKDGLGKFTEPIVRYLSFGLGGPSEENPTTTTEQAEET